MNPTIRTLVFLFAAALAAACARTEPAGPETVVREKIGKAHGVSEFHRIDALRYTFNVQVGDRTIRRSWIWEPGTDWVVYKSESGGADYERGNIGTSEALRAVDSRFVNDNYWLLFPLHVFWDVRATVEDTGDQDLPIGPGKGRRIVIRYPGDLGYTPGDVYEIFVDRDFRIREWVYRKGGAAAPTRITTWENYKRVGPLAVSLEHRSGDGKFRLWFTDVGVKLDGDKLWTEPK